MSSLDTALLDDLACAAALDGIAKTGVDTAIHDADGKVLLLPSPASGGVDYGETLIKACGEKTLRRPG